MAKMSIEPTQDDIDLLINPNEIMEIKGSKTDPISPAPFDRQKAPGMLLGVHPDADVTTIEACLSLSLYHQVTKVSLPDTIPTSYSRLMTC